MTASFGVAEMTAAHSMAQIIETADSMLYKAKLNGRNRVMPGHLRIFNQPEKTAFQNRGGTTVWGLS